MMLFLLGSVSGISAQYSVDYALSMAGNAGSGTFAPYYLSANRHGLVTHGKSGYLRASASRELNLKERFSYEFGADLVGRLSSTSPVDSYQTGQWETHSPRVSSVFIQQLYAGLKYRSLFLWAGSRELTDEVVNHDLSSGGLVWSGNARPVPQVSAGFVDFVDIPGTKGWVQIKGEISYGKYTDSDYLRKHYNYYNEYVTTGVLYHHKSIYFRSNPAYPLTVTLGAEEAVQFGGTTHPYRRGVQIDSLVFKSPAGFKNFLQALIPSPGDSGASEGDQAYVYGNHLGQLNLSVEYAFKDRSSVKGYFEWFFEDGSGLGKLNGWDGLWGLEYNSGDKDYLSGLVLEYLDMTNQSGQLHWYPGYFENATLQVQVTGADDYYNNYFYNGWTHYGASAGTPMVKSVYYNTDGYMKFLHNRVRAVHLGATGYITPEWRYKVLASYRKSWGTVFLPVPEPLYSTSGLVTCDYAPRRLPGWTFSLSLAGDTGGLYGDNWGVSLEVSKKGLLTFKKRSAR